MSQDIQNTLRTFRANRRRLIAKCNRLPDTGIFTILKVLTYYSIVDYSEKHIFPHKANPLPKLNRLLESFSNIMDTVSMMDTGDRSRVKKVILEKYSIAELEATNSQVFGDLWDVFSEERFFEETLTVLSHRLKRNKVDPRAFFGGKEVLDAGCGGGRYSIAIKRLGAKRVQGIDITKGGLRTARAMAKKRKIKNISFREGNSLNIPFPDNKFDIVFSNSVLTFTANIEKGVSECTRVLKSGGSMFLYVVGSPGIYWDLFFLGQEILKNIPKDMCVLALKAFGVPGNRLVYVIDPVFLPHIFISDRQLRALMKRCGLVNFKKLTRGTDYDFNEYLYNPKKRSKYSELLFGDGDLRYIAEKR